MILNRFFSFSSYKWADSFNKPTLLMEMLFSQRGKTISLQTLKAIADGSKDHTWLLGITDRFYICKEKYVPAFSFQKQVSSSI